MIVVSAGVGPDTGLGIEGIRGIPKPHAQIGNDRGVIGGQFLGMGTTKKDSKEERGQGEGFFMFHECAENDTFFRFSIKGVP